MQILDAAPGSIEWYQARLGKITSSNFAKVMTPAKMKLSEQRHALACRIVAERILNWQADSIDYLEHIKAGVEREPDAIRQLQFVYDIDVIPGGFVIADDPRIGGSPDGFVVGSMNPVEIKSPSDPVHLQYLLLSHDVYKAQRQGHLFVCQKDEEIFLSYHPRMPHCMVRTHRDEPFIKALAACLDQFADEVDAMEDRARKLGTFQPYELLTPQEKEEMGNLRSDPLATEEELAEIIEGRHGGRFDWGG